MKKKIKKVVVIILVVIICLSVMINGYPLTYIANWKVYLPITSFYYQVQWEDSGTSFNGDGTRYHMYKYFWDYPIKAMFDWSETERETKFFSGVRETANTWLKEINVDKEYYPDYSRCVYYYQIQDDNSEMLIFLNTDENTFYILEHIM